MGEQQRSAPADVCEEVVSRVGGAPIATACHPPRADDVVILLLPIGVLLFPQIAELTLPGVISLKQKVARQEDEQRRMQTELVRVQQQVSQKTINVFASGLQEISRNLTDADEEDHPE